MAVRLVDGNSSGNRLCEQVSREEIFLRELVGASRLLAYQNSIKQLANLQLVLRSMS